MPVLTVRVPVLDVVSFMEYRSLTMTWRRGSRYWAWWWGQKRGQCFEDPLQSCRCQSQGKGGRRSTSESQWNCCVHIPCSRIPSQYRSTSPNLQVGWSEIFVRHFCYSLEIFVVQKGSFWKCLTAIMTTNPGTKSVKVQQLNPRRICSSVSEEWLIWKHKCRMRPSVSAANNLLEEFPQTPELRPANRLSRITFSF